MIYVISDIHGDYPSFYKMLLKINFSSSDSLCILGDVVDKGSDNLYLLEFIRHMENVCLIKGNHEYLFERYLQGTITASLWDTCGGSATRSEADSLPEEKKRELLAYLKTLPIYKIITVKGEQYFLTHSGYNADYAVRDPKTGLIDIRKSVDQAAAADMERYLFSDDIHFIPASVRFDRKIIVGHYPVIFLPDHGTARIYHGSRYTDIDTGNERRDAGGRLSCLRLDDGREFYV